MNNKSNQGVWIALIIGGSILLTGIIFTYYQQKQRNAEIEYEKYLKTIEISKELQRKEEEETEDYKNKIAYAECLELSYDTYVIDWNNNCKNFSMGKDKSGGETDCLLPERIANVLDESRDKADEQCEILFLR